MKQLYTFIKKEFKHVFRDQKTLLLLFGLPIVQIVLFGFALSNEIKNSAIVIFDAANDSYSQQIIEKFRASKHFTVSASIHDHSDIESVFLQGKVKMALVFPQQFEQDLVSGEGAQIQLIADASDPNTATALTNYATAIVNDFIITHSENNPLPRINIETRNIYNNELKGTTNFVPGVMALVLLLISVLMTSVSIVKEKENGTMEILLVSPFSPYMVIVAKLVPYLLLSVVNLVTILILSVYLLDMPIHGSVLLLMAVSMLFILTALSLGLLISNVTASQQTAMLISLMGMLLPTMMFTGFLFPLENMPTFLQMVANIIPSKWYYIIVKDVMIKGLGFAAIWKETLILVGMTIFLMLVSIKKFKIRLA